MRRYPRASKGIIVLDTSIILPFFGVKVKEVTDDVIAKLEDLSLEYELSYPAPLLAELLGVLSKIFGSDVPEQAKEALASLLREADIRLILPNEGAFY